MAGSDRQGIDRQVIAYISCGAGDFISIDSYLTRAEKEQVSKFYLFTRAAETIKELISMHPVWRGVPVVIPYTTQEIRAFNTYSFFDINHLRKLTGSPWSELNGCLDWSGDKLYPQILKGERVFIESQFEVETIPCDVVCDPVSLSDDRQTDKGRNLTVKQIDDILIGYDERTVNRVGAGQTTLAQALGMVKGCKEFFGVDSMLSCWAARQSTIERIRVKTINPVYRRWKNIYDPFNRVEIMEAISA